MAEVEPEPGAPIAKDKLDPELIRLSRSRPKIGVVTAAGIVFLCALFLWRLNADRRFSGGPAEPEKVTVSDVLAGNVASDRFVTLEAEPVMSHAIRATTAKGSLGLRVVPVRGTADRLWLVVSGDGWEASSHGGYTGRLRKLAALPIAGTVGEFAASHPRPLFATAAEVRAAAQTGKVKTVSGDVVSLADGDKVAFDVIEPDTALLVCTLNDRLPDVAAWQKALASAGIVTTGTPQANQEQVRFEVSLPGAVAAMTSKLEAANLWAARVDPVTHHYETKWAELKGAAPTGFTVEGKTIPDAQLDLVGLYVARAIPDDAYALITGENPVDYWYVLPVTVGVALIGLLFGWALVRAVKRDLLPTRA